MILDDMVGTHRAVKRIGVGDAGPPTAAWRSTPCDDRIMGLLFDGRAADAVVNGHFGKMVGARPGPSMRNLAVDLACVLGKINTVDVARYHDTDSAQFTITQ